MASDRSYCTTWAKPLTSVCTELGTAAPRGSRGSRRPLRFSRVPPRRGTRGGAGLVAGGSCGTMCRTKGSASQQGADGGEGACKKSAEKIPSNMPARCKRTKLPALSFGLVTFLPHNACKQATGPRQSGTWFVSGISCSTLLRCAYVVHLRTHPWGGD